MVDGGGEVTEPGSYTTITVKEYRRMSDAILELRKCKQDARMLLEVGKTEEALALLRDEKI